jgi:hypothetical protein
MIGRGGWLTNRSSSRDPSGTLDISPTLRDDILSSQGQA